MEGMDSGGLIPGIPLPHGETAPLNRGGSYSPPEESFGSALGTSLEHLGSGLAKVSAEADAMAAQEAETSYAKRISETLHGKVDPQSQETTPGFAQLLGHEALKSSAKVTQELAQSRQDIAQGLQNDRQRHLFLGRTQQDLISATRAIESHVGTQIAYLREQGLKTRLDTSMDLSVKSATMRDEARNPVGVQIASQQSRRSDFPSLMGSQEHPSRRSSYE